MEGLPKSGKTGAGCRRSGCLLLHQLLHPAQEILHQSAAVTQILTKISFDGADQRSQSRLGQIALVKFRFQNLDAST